MLKKIWIRKTGKMKLKKIGKDFPVFLHPETKEEYALARQERKSGIGHKGFEFKFDPTVSLEEDLLRRDLTINAIAQDENGNLVDPYGGIEAIKNKLLRTKLLTIAPTSHFNEKAASFAVLAVLSKTIILIFGSNFEIVS